MKNKIMRLAALAPLCLMMTSTPVLAAGESQQLFMKSTQLLNIPVLFNGNQNEKSDTFESLQNASLPEMGTEGTLVAYGIDQKLRVVVEGKMLSVDMECVAISDEDKKGLRELQKKQAEEEKAREEAAQKVALMSTPSEDPTDMNHLDDEEIELEAGAYEWNGSVLTRASGVNIGPSGRETYYNLPMEGVISIMRSMGNADEYWVRDDGVKMLGPYVMVAAHLPTRPRGSLVPTSLGMGIVCDTGTFALNDHTQLDIAVSW